ncbi:hypothetical protein AB6N16_14385 [Pseudomonas marginalis]
MDEQLLSSLATAVFFKMLVSEEFGGIECDAQTYVPKHILVGSAIYELIGCVSLDVEIDTDTL